MPKNFPKKKADVFEGVQLSTRVASEAVERMREILKDHQGHEVLFVCELDTDGKVKSVIDLAHGSPGMVPVPRKQVSCGQVIIHNHPSGSIRPSDADVRLSAQLADEGIGSWVVDSDLKRLCVIVEAYRDSTVLLDEDKLAAMIDSGGALSRLEQHFEPRSGQISMLRTVVKAFNQETLAIIEAGTGIGKTFAYLLPAASWALQNNERIVISTATINLQQQIIDKDIPLISKVLGSEIKAVLAKGRGNYLCKKRLHEAIDEEGLLLDPQDELSHIAQWATTSKDGSKSDFAQLPSEGVWNRINADADNCSGLLCTYRDECFFFKARREAASANIVVANHHLLFADAAMRAQGLGFDGTVVLPSFQRLVLDEAHNIEQGATNFFALTLNKWMVLKYSNLILRRRRGRNFGILAQLNASLPQDSVKTLNLDQIEMQLLACKEATFSFDQEAIDILGGQNTIRINLQTQALLGKFMVTVTHLNNKLLQLVEILQNLLTEIEDLQLSGELPGFIDLQTMIRRISSLCKTCQTFSSFETQNDKVLWIERERLSSGENFAHLIACPLDIAPRLREALFKPYASIVLTSATLTTNNRFDWWAQRLGLREAKTIAGPTLQAPPDEWSGYDSSWYGFDQQSQWKEEKKATVSDPHALESLQLPYIDRSAFRIRVQSPFDYLNRVLLAIPDDAPDPASENYQNYLSSFIVKGLRISGGHALVLFTSYDMLSKTWEQVKKQLEGSNVTLFKQGDMERSRLLSQFTLDISSCLFATESFWEGVDSPGQTLQVVILCRLPFKVPSEPLQIARSETIAANGGNPFTELSVPEAVMKFRQGFGRLMRRTEDFGIVLVPDRRIVSKSYGKTFLNSLPPCGKIVASTDVIFEEMQRFLTRMRTT